MEYVHPIKDTKQIRIIKKLLKGKSTRDYLLFVFGINTGLRISEILPLKYEDILNEDREVISYLSVNGENIFINDQIKKAVNFHIRNYTDFSPSDYLFESKRGTNSVTRQHAYRTIHDAARKVGINEKIGTHTLRKTFGYHAYTKGIALSLIQKRFHQSSPSETLRYIGIDNTQKQKIDVNL